MLTTLKELEDAIYDWLLLATGREIVSGGYDEMQGSSVPSIAFEIKNINNHDHPTRSLSVDGLTESIEQSAEIKIKIVVLGGSAMQAINRVIASTWSATRSFDLWKICGLGGFTPPIDLTALETGALRQRWESTLTLYATIGEDFTGEYFESYKLTVNETDLKQIHLKDQPVDPLENC